MGHCTNVWPTVCPCFGYLFCTQWTQVSQCHLESLEKREDKWIPSDFLMKIMDLILKYNIFEFHDGQLWKQLYGVAMGIHPALSFANIYLDRRLDDIMAELGNKYGGNGKSAFKIFKRFVGDLFQIFTGTTGMQNIGILGSRIPSSLPPPGNMT